MSRVFQCTRVCVYLAVFVGLIGCANWAAADMVPNGGFDTDLSGWTGDGWQWVPANMTGSQGGPAALFVNGGTSSWLTQPGITTPPAFVAGQSYELAFLAAMGGGVTPLDAEIVTGSGTHSMHIEQLNPAPYTAYSIMFTATAADVGQPFEARFFATANTIVGIDSVALNLVSVPEPSTVVMLGMGLLGLLAYAWRKRK